ncbi:hypothetical protein [Maricaulis sp. CAU 1757]
MPETALHAPGQGARLVRCSDGFEGQIWESNVLAASRWWPERPDDRAWQRFLRGARMSGPATAPEPVRPTWLAHARRQPLALRLLRLRDIHWKDLGAMAIALLVAPALYLAAQLAFLEIQKSSLSNELSGLREATSELGAARTATQAAIQELAIYAEQIDRVHPTELLAVFAETVAAYDAELQEFSLRDNSLTIQISAPDDFAPAPLVQALERLSDITGVLIEPGRQARSWTVLAEVEDTQ